MFYSNFAVLVEFLRVEFYKRGVHLSNFPGSMLILGGLCLSFWGICQVLRLFEGLENSLMLANICERFNAA